MTSTTRAVLEFLATRDRPLVAQDIAAAMKLCDGRSVTASLVSLHAHGLVERTAGPPPKPGRWPEVKWSISEQGRQAAAQPARLTDGHQERWT